MKILSVLLLFFTSFFVRAFRWFSIIQQKEYRFDRLMLFLNTNEGKKELFRLIPKKKDFSRTGLKRPRITARILLVSILFVIQFALLLLLLVTPFFNFMVLILKSVSILVGLLVVLYFIFVLLLILFIIPFLVMVSILPTTFISSIKIFLELYKAKNKVKKSNPTIIGITGSYGKTSTKMLLAKVLEKKYSVFKTPKSYNTKFSVAKSINQGFRNQEIIIIEYAAYKKGEIKKLASWFKPKLAIITGLAKQHLGLFGNIESVIAAKAELIESLDLGSTVICNGDDKGAIEICESGSRIQAKKLVNRIGLDEGSRNNLKLSLANNDNEDSNIIKANLNKSGKLFFVWNGQQVNTNLIGMHYLEIVRMVILVAKQFGLKDEEIVSALSSFIPDDKFIFSYEMGSGNLVIDDGGTSNPKGFKAAIELANRVDNDHKVLITSGIVDLGSESDDIHEELANKAAEVFDTVICVGKSGSEQFSNIFEKSGKRFFSDQSKIIESLSNLKNNEMILVEGKMPGWIKVYLK